VLLYLVLCAFEYAGCTGRAAAMLAGTAFLDQPHSALLNPALSVGPDRVSAGVAYTRPYGLPGLAWSRVLVGWSSARVGAALGLSSLALGSYREHDACVTLGVSPRPGVSLGLGLHALRLETSRVGDDLAPAFDAGACWRLGRVSIAAAGLRLNSPRWRDGAELPVRLVLAGSWYPVDELALALDLDREGSDEDAAFGAEFRLVPQLGLRIGVRAAPLRFGAGLGAALGPLEFDYAYQFHPVLKDSHIFGLRVAWH